MRPILNKFDWWNYLGCFGVSCLIKKKKKKNSQKLIWKHSMLSIFRKMSKHSKLFLNRTYAAILEMNLFANSISGETNILQAYLVLLHFTLLGFTDVMGFGLSCFCYFGFFGGRCKLKARPSSSQKITTCFIAVVWKGTCNISEACL